MDANYDVVIVGAGPTGAQCARYLCQNSKLRVALLEQSQEIGEPKKSTAGTFDDALAEFSIPTEVIMQRTESVILEGPKERVSFPISGAVLEFGKLKKFLVEEAIKHGCTLSIATSVTHPIVEDGKVVGVRYHGLDGEGEVRAPITVDASGPVAILARQTGVRSMSDGLHAKGMEMEIEGLEQFKEKDVMLLKFDQRYAPGGYAWIFSAGEGRAKVGVCWVDDHFEKMGGQGSVISYLHKWMREDPRLQNGRAMEIHGGDAFISGKQLPRVMDGLVCIGDSVCSINPILGEGIRPGMKSANYAAKAIIAAAAAGRSDKEALSQYQRDWETYAREWHVSEELGRIIYTAPNDRIDQILRFVKKGTEDDKEMLYRFVTYSATKKDLFTCFKNNVF